MDPAIDVAKTIPVATLTADSLGSRSSRLFITAVQPNGWCNGNEIFVYGNNGAADIGFDLIVP
ncbi:hypothetical protein [Streptosporangium sandarakinum]|uniref:hypothetical protein n=1 Tax=Streptosporangium sandarakinum TaxID=1260955 RepID=UPI00344A0B49